MQAPHRILSPFLRLLAALPVCLPFAAASCATKAPPPPAKADAPAKPSEPARPSSPLGEAGAESLEPLLQELRTVETATLTAPDDQQMWVRLATLLREANRTQEAARAAWRAVEIESNFFSWTSLGNVLSQGDVFMSMGAAVGAFQAYKMAAQQAPEPTQAARNFLGLAYRDFGLGHDKQALELIAEAEALSPREPLVYFDRACVFAAQGRAEAAQAEARKALALLNEVSPDQTPSDPALATMRPLAEAIARGEPVSRPGLLASGEMLPERFWAKPPQRGTALSLGIDESSDRFIPLVPEVAMRLRVPSNWAHRTKATDRAVHVRLAPPGGERGNLVQITVFPVLKENFDVKRAAEAGRQVAVQDAAEASPLMPLERGKGLGFWFESSDRSVDGTNPPPGQYARLWQGFAFTSPFAISATWLGQRSDEHTQQALLALLRSFEVFRIETQGQAQ